MWWIATVRVGLGRLVGGQAARHPHPIFWASVLCQLHTEGHWTNRLGSLGQRLAKKNQVADRLASYSTDGHGRSSICTTRAPRAGSRPGDEILFLVFARKGSGQPSQGPRVHLAGAPAVTGTGGHPWSSNLPWRSATCLKNVHQFVTERGIGQGCRSAPRKKRGDAASCPWGLSRRVPGRKTTRFVSGPMPPPVLL